MQICTPDDVCRIASISDLFVYENFGRAPRDVVEAGDICAVTGLGDVMIGQTIACRTAGVALPTITVEEPTVRMSFSINTSPFAGKEVSQNRLASSWVVLFCWEIQQIAAGLEFVPGHRLLRFVGDFRR